MFFERTGASSSSFGHELRLRPLRMDISFVLFVGTRASSSSLGHGLRLRLRLRPLRMDTSFVLFVGTRASSSSSSNGHQLRPLRRDTSFVLFVWTRASSSSFGHELRLRLLRRDTGFGSGDFFYLEQRDELSYDRSEREYLEGRARTNRPYKHAFDLASESSRRRCARRTQTRQWVTSASSLARLCAYRSSQMIPERTILRSMRRSCDRSSDAMRAYS